VAELGGELYIGCADCGAVNKVTPVKGELTAGVRLEEPGRARELGRQLEALRSHCRALERELEGRR
jgi:hypothetical protein